MSTKRKTIHRHMNVPFIKRHIPTSSIYNGAHWHHKSTPMSLLGNTTTKHLKTTAIPNSQKP